MKYIGLITVAMLLMMGCGGNSSKIELSDGPRRAEILFLGHESTHHNSEKLMPGLARHLFQQGINLTYTADPDDLNAEKLRLYDGLMIYANHDEITAEQETALKEYVEGGKALIPIHSASFCFRNSDWFVEAVGGQFSSHGTGDFTASITDSSHPVMEGISEFETWDETYVHSELNEDMTVLMERVEGDHREPYTWVREQGKGRVFYTAYGHDERTWNQPEFLKLVANGVLWAVGEKVAQQVADYDIPQTVFEDAVIPNYENRDPAPRYQLPLSPEESMKLVQVPVGFELQLFASEPDIINPMAMCWDDKGRLYVIETTDYPNEVRQEGGDDKIKILEDTDGDGKADKITVFAEGLNIPTSMVYVNGGILISMAPDFVFLKDTDGDDKADQRETIITGWGKSDTHAGPSNLRYGFDNKIWGVLGYSGFRGEIDNKPFSFSQGVYRFDPDGTDFEFLGNTSNNTWGLGFSEENNVFISTANGQHSAYLAMPGKYVRRPVHGGSVNAVHGIDSHYDMPHLTPFLRQVDWHGGYTAAAGHHFYTARNFPKSYWNRVAFVAEPTGRVLHNAIIEKDGSGFVEKNGFNILASSDEWFSPVHAEVGPDGALWIADWYNFIIQHNPTPKGFENGEGNAYINPMRDREHGRIYRMVYKGSDNYQTMDIDPSSNSDLISGLKSDNMFWRMTAQKLIVENQNTSITNELLKLVDNTSVDEIGLNSPAVHALWALHGTGALDGSNEAALEVVTRALNHPAAGVRKNALMVLPRDQQVLQAILDANLLNDPDLNTRKAAFLAVADMPSSDAASKLILEASNDADNSTDDYLPQAIFAAVLSHPQSFNELSGTILDVNKPDSLMTLGEKVTKSLVEEQYSLDRRAGIPYPPEIAGKEIHVQATISKADEALEGVILAQGNAENGYSLYIQNNRIYWLVKQAGKTYQATSRGALPEQQFELKASLLENGDMAISIDDKQVGSAMAPGLFSNTLSPDRVRIGHDNMGSDQVGTYPDRFYFRGRMNSRTSHLNLKVPADDAGESSTASAEVASGSTAGAVTIKMGVIQHEMKFDKPTFTVKAGQQVTIDFVNDDFMQHNLLIGKAGSLETIGKAADALARDPNGMEMNFVPKIPEVLAATPLVNPETSESLVFTAPTEPGEYPYLCTVPGHWRIMNGIMIVE
ncbi:PVC-type heme-binding CxxCH protein [Cyclobacterium sp.]|uniref:PVC-type heme-binding CxxCH protein n=1 Tax=Cyclobacterium sp. TaxID=1966343 RepID=UPI001985266A|nr:PVC-type heme-binding CxxCH protein [Cyclobacterium sp.]MBD3628537.1 ThuA domain-containing protein [Cyclobacterium sp.]